MEITAVESLVICSFLWLQQAGPKTTIVRTGPSSVISVAKPGVTQAAPGKQTIVIAAPKSGTRLSPRKEMSPLPPPSRTKEVTTEAEQFAARNVSWPVCQLFGKEDVTVSVGGKRSLKRES